MNEPERRLIATRVEYRAACQEVLELAAREICVFDADLEQYDLGHTAQIATLAAVLRANREHTLHIALHDTRYVERRCPRLLALLQQFPLQVAIHRTLDEARRAQDSFVLADRKHVARKPVAAQSRGVLLRDDPLEGQGMRERFAQIWAASEAAFGASTLGL